MQGLMDLGGGVGWIGTLLIGGLAGWIAEKVMNTNHGIVMNVIVGVIGSYIGAFLANALGIRSSFEGKAGLSNVSTRPRLPCITSWLLSRKPLEICCAGVTLR